MNRFESRLMERYSGHSYEIKSRVRLFFRFGLILLPFLAAFIIFLNLTMQRELFSAVNISIIFLMTMTVLCLFILINGRYNISVNLMVTVMLLATFMIANRTIQHGNSTRLVASIIPTISLVVFGILFCKPRISITVTILAIAGFFYNIISSGLLDTGEMGSALTALSLSTILTALLSGFIVRIGEQSKNLRSREHDMERNRQIELNRSLLDSLTEVSVRLDETSHRMSENSATFSENMQGEASSMEEITATVEEVSSGLDNVSISARDQSELMISLTAKIDEMYGSSRDMAASMTEALSRTSDIMARAQSGGKSLEDMEASMKAISDTSREMTGIVNMINDISDRINLLSLNASIEAARAGEYGRGFAVVADEISKLADQTTGSVKEIDRLIKQSDAEITRGMDNAGSTVEAITGIIDSINEIGSMIETMSVSVEQNVVAGEEVNRSSDNVKIRSDEITTATEEHKKAADEIVRSITSINQLIQSNAMRAQDMAEHLKSIAEMAEKVKTSMCSFDMSVLEADSLEHPEDH